MIAYYCIIKGLHKLITVGDQNSGWNYSVTQQGLANVCKEVDALLLTVLEQAFRGNYDLRNPLGF